MSDLVEAPGLTIWGAVFDIDDGELGQLDRKEGVKIGAYQRSYLNVTFQRKATPVMTYTVIDKSQKELPPSPGYIQAILAGAQEVGLPNSYIAFLEWLEVQTISFAADFRKGSMVVSTANRLGARGLGIVRTGVIPDESADFATVRFEGKELSVRWLQNSGIPEGVCQLDQNVRHALGIAGSRCYGHTIAIKPSQHFASMVSHIVAPRFLYLPVHQPAWQDAEKNICVLHPRNIALLGLSEGEFVNILASSSDGVGGSQVMYCLSLRVFAGSEQRPNIDNSIPTRSYPDVDKIYLDAEAREILGLKSGVVGLGYPVALWPNVKQVFLSRVMYYGLTLLLGAAASISALTALIPDINTIVRGVVALALSTTIAVLLATIDLRSRLRY